MSHAYTTAGWENFFFAEVGASAALVGLLFVAVSINLGKIVAFPSLPGRAMEAIILLAMVLLAATFALVPGQPSGWLGGELLGVGGVAWIVPMVIQRRTAVHPNVEASWVVARVIATQLATLPMLVAGATLLAECGGGLYWTVPAVVAAFLAALFDAWVLLVEIQR